MAGGFLLSGRLPAPQAHSHLQTCFPASASSVPVQDQRHLQEAFVRDFFRAAWGQARNVPREHDQVHQGFPVSGAKTLSLCIDRQHMYETVSLENKMGIYPMAPPARFVVSRKTCWPQAFSS